jgi:hypothetical protein
MTKHVTCALCKQQFETARSDEDALTEARQVFGRQLVDHEPLAVVCDDCYQLFLEWKRTADLRE